jgi:hypothetical protein
MKLMYCKKDYGYFEAGEIYYLQEMMIRNGMTWSRYYLVHLDSLGKNLVGEIGYLVDDVFEDLTNHRERLLTELLETKFGN